MGVDKNFIHEFDLWTQESLGRIRALFLSNYKQDPPNSSRKYAGENNSSPAAGTKTGQVGFWNQSGRFWKPIRPVLWDLAS
jgi:hypothetical protein